MPEDFEWKKADQDLLPPVIAVADPITHADWWFGHAPQAADGWGANVGDVYRSPDGTWARQAFTTGAAYLFGEPLAGPFWLDADIDRAYFQPAVGDLSPSGGPGGPLGRLLQDTVDFVEGGRVAVFEHGHIYSWPDTGARTLAPALVDVRFDRLHCHVETSGPGSDEPYLVLSMYSPTGGWAQLATFSEVDAGGTHRRDMTLYNGAPVGAYLVTSLWEQDAGSPEQAREKAGHIVEASAAAIAAGLHLVPGIGGVLAVGTEVLEKLLAEPLAELVSDALGLEDDKIGDARAILSPKSMIVSATDTQLAGGEPPTLTELRFRGDGGDYSAFISARTGRAPIPALPATGDRMLPGQTLSPGAWISSTDSRFTLIYQDDGNLVLYRNADGHPLWNSRTQGTSPGIAVMQHDGNLVVYDPNIRASYATGSDAPGSSLVVQNDGNMVIYAPSGAVSWASNTVQ